MNFIKFKSWKILENFLKIFSQILYKLFCKNFQNKPLLSKVLLNGNILQKFIKRRLLKNLYKICTNIK